MDAEFAKRMQHKVCTRPSPVRLQPPPRTPQQERLAVSDEEFAKWKFAFCTKHLPPESLGDEDTIGQVFIRAKSELKVDTDVFLGMQVRGAGGRGRAGGGRKGVRGCVGGRGVGRRRWRGEELG